MQNETFAALLAGPLFAIVFPLFWCSICWMLARVGGWYRWAEAYPDSKGHSGTRKGMVSASFPYCRYNGTLVLSADSEALTLSQILPFRFGHHPVRLPWSELTVTKDRSWFSDRVTLEAEKVPGLKMTMYRSTYDSVSQGIEAAPQSGEADTPTTRPRSP